MLLQFCVQLSCYIHDHYANVLMQGIPAAAEKAASVQPRSLSAMKVDPAVLSAVQLQHRSLPKKSDHHASTQSYQVSS